MPNAPKTKRRYDPTLEREVEALVKFVDRVDNRVPTMDDVPLFGVDDTFADVSQQFGFGRSFAA